MVTKAATHLSAGYPQRAYPRGFLVLELARLSARVGPQGSGKPFHLPSLRGSRTGGSASGAALGHEGYGPPEIESRPVWSHSCALDDLIVPYAIDPAVAGRLETKPRPAPIGQPEQ